MQLPRLPFGLMLTWALTACGTPPASPRPPAPPLPPADKALPVPGEAFLLHGHEAFVILPRERADGRTPWVLYAPTLHPYPSAAEKWLFERLLAKGIAIAGIDVGESYGSPAGCALYDELYDHLVQNRGLSPQTVLLARSRGGLMTLCWAADRPERIAAFAGIYPVCDLRSYPGLAQAAGAYGTTAAGLAAMLPRCNPIDRVAGLVHADVPFFALHGDHDKTVPIEANSGALAERVRSLGGAMELHVLPGRGHDMDPGFFESEELLAFVVRHAH